MQYVDGAALPGRTSRRCSQLRQPTLFGGEAPRADRDSEAVAVTPGWGEWRCARVTSK